jgi:hypothetical protein
VDEQVRARNRRIQNVLGIIGLILLVILWNNRGLPGVVKLQRQRQYWHEAQPAHYRMTINNSGYRFPCPPAILEVEGQVLLSVTALEPKFDLGPFCEAAYEDLTVDGAFDLAERYLRTHPGSVKTLEYDDERGFITELTIIAYKSALAEAISYNFGADWDELAPASFFIHVESFEEVNE